MLRAMATEGAHMRPRISLIALGHTASLFFAITFTLCIAFDLAFPAHADVRSVAQASSGL